VFHGEVQAVEHEHHLQRTVAAFKDFQAGRLPTGPGARALIEAFQHVDAALKDAEHSEPTVLDNERRVENLLRQQAGTLHVGAANYCWFRDPAMALCLRLAGTPTAKSPLVGMCDSARCPQATHHPCHRPIWAHRAETTAVFLSNPRTPPGEKTRLAAEHERNLRVLAEIDAAANGPTPARKTTPR